MSIETTVEKEYEPGVDGEAVEAGTVERVVLSCANGCGRVIANITASTAKQKAAVVARDGENCLVCQAAEVEADALAAAQAAAALAEAEVKANADGV